MPTTPTARVPFIDPAVLRRHRVLEPTDGRFRAAARLCQALYRERHGWRCGGITNSSGKTRRIGNYLSTKDADAGANFLTPELALLARRETAYREDGALIEQRRLRENLLSSAPLVFNLIGPLKLDLKLATKFARRLWPDLVERVVDVLFEHSPGRREADFTHDRSAFDALLQCVDRDGRPTFIAIEVKYSETLFEPIARLRPRYHELSREAGLFVDPDSPMLRIAPFQGLWRETLLAAAMVQNKLYHAGRFVLICPAANSQVQRAAAAYKRQLLDDGCIKFDVLSLEQAIDAMARAGNRKHSQALTERYADYTELDQFI